MGLRGPPPKATALRLLEGNPGKHAINGDEPQPQGRAIPPAWLSKVARREWRRLAPTLEACGLLTYADSNAFGEYCEALANYIAATARVQEEGHVIEDRLGRRVNPSVSAQSKFFEQTLRLGQRFGLTPSDRTGIKVTTPKRGKWAALIA